MKIIKLIFPLLFFSVTAFGFQNIADVEIEIVPVHKNVYMLKGAGGNIGVLTGNDGLFMIDDQFAPLSQKIISKLRSLSDKPVRFLVNTHHHGDHTGGNRNFKENGALIFAHTNVRKRLAGNEKLTATDLPVITFDEKIHFHLNGNDILVVHVHNAHTDGDVLIYFPQSNVLHTGDTFFNGMFPYIDLKSGGSVNGDISAARTGLSLINEDTKIIPGHGPLASFSDYKAYVEMLEKIKNNIQKAIKQGMTEEEIVANESLTKEFYSDEETSGNFISGPKIRRTFYNDLKNNPGN